MVDIQQLTNIIAREADYYSVYRRSDCMITDDYETLMEQLRRLRRIENDLKFLMDFNVQIKKI
jgi:hypothetical protein